MASRLKFYGCNSSKENRATLEDTVAQVAIVFSPPAPEDENCIPAPVWAKGEFEAWYVCE